MVIPFLLIGLATAALLTDSPHREQGEPTKTTNIEIDPVERIESMTKTLGNCDFSARLERKSTGPSLSFRSVTADITCKACADAIVWKASTTEVKNDPAAGQNGAPTESWAEHRWVRGEPQPRWLVSLSVGKKGDWPLDVVPMSADIHISMIAAFADRTQNLRAIWQDIPVGDLLTDLDYSGITLKDIVSPQSVCGFRLDERTRLQGHEKDVVLRYSSDRYGLAAITYSRANDWLPSKIEIVKSADHKIALDGLLPEASNLVRNYKTLDSFSKQSVHLDGIEYVYTISYTRGPSAQPISPCTITKTTTYKHLNERAITETILSFRSFESGEVTSNDVLSAMIPIPDGAVACIVGDKDLKRIAWTTKDGKLIKRIDLEAAHIGSDVEFSSHRRFSIIVTLNIIAILVGAIIYRRYHLT